MTPLLVLALVALAPPLPQWPALEPIPPGRVLTARWLHVGVRPALHVSPDDVSVGVTVQVTTPFL